MASPVTFLTVDKKGRATLPEDVRSDLGLSSGDLVLLEKTDRGTWELKAASLVPRDQLWFHHPEMRSRLTKAEADFASERSTRTRTPAQAQKFLDSLKGRSRSRR